MFNKNKEQYQSTWSLSMLEELINYFRHPLQPGEISFLIKERETSISFDVTTIKELISYSGGIAYKDLENVYFALSSWEHQDLTEGYLNFMGYIEILNGISSQKRENVPMIRGFIKKGFSFFESVNKLLIESKLFNKRMALSITVDLSGIAKIPTEDLFDMISAERTIKLPIERVDVFQRVSFE